MRHAADSRSSQAFIYLVLSSRQLLRPTPNHTPTNPHSSQISDPQHHHAINMASTTSRSLHSQPASKRSRVSIVVGATHAEAGGARSPPDAHIGRQGLIGRSRSLRQVGTAPTAPFRKVSGIAKDSMKGLRALGQDMHSAMHAIKDGNDKKPQKMSKVRAGPKYKHIPMVCNGGAGTYTYIFLLRHVLTFG